MNSCILYLTEILGYQRLGTVREYETADFSPLLSVSTLLHYSGAPERGHGHARAWLWTKLTNQRLQLVAGLDFAFKLAYLMNYFL
jgi:hypothetical protein